MLCGDCRIPRMCVAQYADECVRIEGSTTLVRDGEWNYL